MKLYSNVSVNLSVNSSPGYAEIQYNDTCALLLPYRLPIPFQLRQARPVSQFRATEKIRNGTPQKTKTKTERDNRIALHRGNQMAIYIRRGKLVLSYSSIPRLLWRSFFFLSGSGRALLIFSNRGINFAAVTERPLCLVLPAEKKKERSVSVCYCHSSGEGGKGDRPRLGEVSRCQ